MARFFSKYDWAAFWVATLVAFGVYFYTLGPSVGLEDSGELATAAAHLGVPHPPGYPFWTFCSWIFCKVFSFVTYMGHPTPAWSVSCCSAVFGALAAGCTAMLISRSARDFVLTSARTASSLSETTASWLCFAGGTGGALAFAFSPVEWSQATIVEIYSLNALFLMLVFLLSYRWMRQPSDRVLWATAFVFGLGLTNYQVLLFAIVPLAVIIMLRNIPMFRDFALYLVPVLLTYQVLDVGSLERAQYGMERDTIAKHAPCGMSDLEYSVLTNFELYNLYLTKPNEFADVRKRYESAIKYVTDEIGRSSSLAKADELKKQKRLYESVLRQMKEIGPKAKQISGELKKRVTEGKRPELKTRADHSPSPWTTVPAALLVIGSLFAAVWLKSRDRVRPAVLAAAGGGGAGLALLLLGSLFAGERVWVAAEQPFAPLLDPLCYVAVAVAAGGSAIAAVVAAVDARRYRVGLIASAGCAALAAVLAWFFSSPDFDLALAFGYAGKDYVWGKSTFLFASVLAFLFALSAFVKKGLCYAIPVAGLQVAAFILLRNGAMNGLTHPSTWWFWWPVAWNFVVFALVWLVLPHGRSVVGAAFFTQLGVSFYAYMPLVSDWRNPPMNWGYPRTWEGFKHAITRGQYEQIKAEQFATAEAFWNFLKVQMGHYVRDVKLQFTDFLVLLAGLPFACWHFCVRTARRPFAVRLLWVGAALLGVFLVKDLVGCVVSGEGLGGVAFDRALLWVFGTLAAAGCAVIGMKQFVYRPALALGRYVEACVRRRETVTLVALGVLAGEIVLVPAVLCCCFNGSGKSLALAASWVFAMALLAVNYRLVARFVRRVRRDVGYVGFDARNVFQQWLISSGACFLMMSVILLVLAKVVGDVQDGFIQKVKFISSHAMIAMWIGYGLVVVAAAAVRFVPPRHRKYAVGPFVVLLVLVGALPPIVQNYVNDRLVFELGGAEQNGHTFGWQFGAYQLEGAKAVREQLGADEEPLPDPEWPSPMEDHAVFFGGTDAGRFIPTYMIYSANFRPDVYLITQNALADGTYMAVERDLYGDEIWIPSGSDNGLAFDRFVSRLTPEEERMYGVDKSNGRVQVTGANSVMKINEILAQMMFEKNSPRHAFYVEESYPIPWMYDYLRPHGLVMKIGPDRTPDLASDALWQDVSRKDRDFWDWYCRRLLDDPMYRRDFAAQKSFSKLRSAEAGLYQQKWLARFGDASDAPTVRAFRENCLRAYREACLLAPVSPESTFRAIRMAMMDRPGAVGHRQWLEAHPGDYEGAELARCRLPDASLDAIEELLDYIDEQDPHNQRTASHRPYVKAWRDLTACERAFREAGSVRDSAAALKLGFAYADLAEAEGLGRYDLAPFFRRVAAERIVGAYAACGTDDELLRAARVLVDCPWTGARTAGPERSGAMSRRYGQAVLDLCRRYIARTGSDPVSVEVLRLKALLRPVLALSERMTPDEREFSNQSMTMALQLLARLVAEKDRERELMSLYAKDPELKDMVDWINQASQHLQKNQRGH